MVGRRVRVHEGDMKIKAEIGVISNQESRDMGELLEATKGKENSFLLETSEGRLAFSSHFRFLTPSTTVICSCGDLLDHP